MNNNWKAMETKLTVIARDFLKDAYHLELTIPIKVNSRLKATYGRFVHKKHEKQAVKIEISQNYLLNQSWELIRSTLIHECIHYALYQLDKPYRDGDAYFEAELKKHGSHSTHTVEYKGKVEQYRCSACGVIFNRRKKYPNGARGLHHKECNAQIEYIGQKII